MVTDRVVIALALAPDPANVPRARSQVMVALREAGVLEDTVDTAGLLLSELVTNAVLHARTPIEVNVTLSGEVVRVEVSDSNSRLPIQRLSDDEATTGRGIELVELLASSSGASRIDGAGKVVWFTLGGADTTSSAYELGEAPPDDLTVTLAGAPTALFSIWLQHAATLLREHLLICLDPSGPVDARATTDAATANAAFAALVAAADDALAVAADSGSPDLVLALSREAAGSFGVLDDVLTTCLGEASAGLLLAPPGQPEIVAVQRWCCEQVRVQSDGQPATPWRPAAATAPALDWTAPAWDAEGVRVSKQALVAADDANRILAVSASAAELLGWPAEELTGRRILTIVPAELHEAHIVGFVRYLLSGKAAIIGRPVDVPAQRRDGTQVMVTLHLTAHAVAGGRAVFVAEFTPQAGD